MELPVIVTNCSGPAAYATDDNAYLIPVADAPDAFGFFQPDLEALKTLMRRVVEQSVPDGEAYRRGAQARKTMQEISPHLVASMIAERLRYQARRRGWVI
jgi:hypothetical protein